MNKFQEMYERLQVINEDLYGVPASKLNVFTSLKDIPMKRPYGFWVDNHGNFIPVPFMGHSRIAAQLIYKACEISKKEIKEPPIYETMYQNDWMRVISDTNEHLYYSMGSYNKKPSYPQLKFLNFIKEFYEIQGSLIKDDS